VGIAGLGVDPAQDANLFGRFVAYVLEKDREATSVFEACIRRSASLRGSSMLFLAEWKAFIGISGFDSQQNEQVRESCLAAIDIKHYLRAMKDRPLMFLASAEISHLKAMVEGLALTIERFAEQGQLNLDFADFEAWLRLRLPINARCPWDMLLSIACGGNGVRAFEMFFEELSRYESERQSSADLR